MSFVQRSRVPSENARRETDEQDDDTTTLRKNLSLLLKEQENSQRSNKYVTLNERYTE